MLKLRTLLTPSVSLHCCICLLMVVCNPGFAMGAHPGPPPGDPEASSEASMAEAAFVLSLCDTGWEPDAASAVAEINCEWLTSTPANSAEYKSVTARLARLGPLLKSEDFSLLKRAPQFAPWIAAAADPARFCRAVRKHRNSEQVLGNILLLQHDFANADKLAQTWSRFGKQIAMSWNAQLPGVESLFQSAAFGNQDEAYLQWLGDLFNNDAFEDSDRLVSRIVFCILQGPQIRYRLSSQELSNREFQQSFPRLWSRFLSATAKSKRPLELFASNPQIWEILLRPDGDVLVQEYGVIPAILFCGDICFPRRLHDRVLALLKLKKRAVMTVLLNHRGNAHLHALLARPDVSDEYLLRIFDDVLRKQDDQHGLLGELRDKTDKEIQDRYRRPVDLDSWDDHLPSYLKIPKRLVSGQPLDDNDTDKLAVDIVAGLLTLLSAYTIPPQAVDFVQQGVGQIAFAAGDSSDEALKRRQLAFNDQSKRIRELLSARELRQAVDQAFTPQLMTEALQAARHLSDRGPEQKTDFAAQVLLFLYSQSRLWNRESEFLADTKLAPHFDGQGRLWLIRAGDSTIDFRRDAAKTWVKSASRRWISFLSTANDGLHPAPLSKDP